MASLTVAIAQFAPAYLQLRASMTLAERLLREAAGRGAKLVAFGETWLSGYPAWLDYCPAVALWDHEPTKEVFARTRQSSVLVPGPETDHLSKLCKELAVALVIGVCERVERGPGNGTLYNALLLFDERGTLCVHHRKLVPTHGERLLWGQGDGRGLESATVCGAQVGGLICWEHWMPLARQAMHVAGEQLHVALWPWGNDMHQLASRHYAIEGRCFVLVSGLIMAASDLPPELGAPRLDGTLALRGGSAIIAPDGRYQVEPVLDREELIVAELDLDFVDRERMTLDVSGHYHRPDLFHFELRKGRGGSGS